MQVDFSGNLLAAGHTSISSLDSCMNAGRDDVLLMSFSNRGAWQWTTLRGGGEEDTAHALKAGCGSLVNTGQQLGRIIAVHLRLSTQPSADID